MHVMEQHRLSPATENDASTEIAEIAHNTSTSSSIDMSSSSVRAARGESESGGGTDEQGVDARSVDSVVVYEDEPSVSAGEDQGRRKGCH
jgi:hypothetical protein